MKAEYYNVLFKPVNSDPEYREEVKNEHGEIVAHRTTKVLVKGSMQHIWSERTLRISKASHRRLLSLEAGRNGHWVTVFPTPYGPAVAWSVS